MKTFLIEIEAELNSRPLYDQSSDPNDPFVITPSRLLNGRNLNTLPEKSFLSVPDNRLSTNNFITKIKQDSCHKEYLNELQIRQKCHEIIAELTIGFVIILINNVNSSIPTGRSY
uniref:Uncharacterized protein n=1 Tax=Trichogramma kaykai TaxID=54128 RepID=A0ABD2W1L9_9HYME